MARYAKSISMATSDTKPDVYGHIMEAETGTALDITAADSVWFGYWDLVADATMSGFPKVATVVTAASGEVKYEWDNTGAETDTDGRYAVYFIVYWGASETEPQTTTAVELTISPASERM